MKLCQLTWQPNEDMTALADFDATLEPRHATLRVSYRAMEIILDSARGSLSLGRDKSAELVIEDTKTLRLHCRVECRVNKFVLVDRSTNGTYVTFQGDPEVVLKREELALRGHGWIALGLPRADTAELVEFFCEGWKNHITSAASPDSQREDQRGGNWGARRSGVRCGNKRGDDRRWVGTVGELRVRAN